MTNKIDVNVSDEINIECDITIGQGEKGDKGDSGEKVLLQKNDTHVQYKHESDELWIDLIPIVELKGENGKEIELRKSQTHIQFRYAGDTNWIDLVELSLLKGDAFKFEDFTPEQLLIIKGDKGDTPSITHLEEKIDTKVSEVNNLMLDVEEGEKNRDDNEETRKIQESQRINSFKDIQTNSNKKIEELNVAKNDMTNTVTNSLEDFERRFGELESANPIGEVTQSRIATDGTVKSSLSERLTYDFNKKANSDSVYTKNETYNKKEVDNAIANVEVDLSGYATKEEVNAKPSKTYVDTQDTKVLEDAKTYVDSVVDKVNNFAIVTVTELPQTGESNKVYLVRNSQTKGDLYTEYIWVNDDWEVWGSASVDLSTYATKEELKTKSDITHNHDGLYASKSNEHTHANKSVIDSITTSKVESWDNKSDFDGNYDSLKGKPTIPTVDVNKAYVDGELAKKSNVHNHPYKSDTYVPTWDETLGKPSAFPPSEHNHNENYYQKEEVNSFVQVIDNEYIDGLFSKTTGDESNPIDYYTKAQSDEKYATKEELKNIDIDTSNLATKAELKEVKQSVSNGKTLIASAITDSGVSTSSEDTFQTMANNIRNISRVDITAINVTNVKENGEYTLTYTCTGRIITSHELKIGDKEYITISPIKEGDIYTYNGNGLTHNTVLTCYLKITSNSDVVTSNPFVINVPKAKIYGVRISRNNWNAYDSVTYIEDSIGMGEATRTSYGKWGDVYPFSEIKPCGFKNGKVIKYINPNDFTKYVDGTDVGDDVDVMIEFPKVYWEFSGYSPSEVRLSSVKISDTYICPAHTANGKEYDKLYVGAYLGYNKNGVLRSIKDVKPTTGTLAQLRTFATANGVGYQQMSPHTMTMLRILFLLLYKSINSQFALGGGYTFINNKGMINTGGTYNKGMIYGEDNGYVQMKMCGLEDLWGNHFQWVDGCATKSNKYYYAPDNSGFNEDKTGYKTYTIGYGSNVELDKYVVECHCNNEVGFLPSTIAGSSTTNYGDHASLDTSDYWQECATGGRFYDDGKAGIFASWFKYSYGHGGTGGARLVYIGGE